MVQRRNNTVSSAPPIMRLYLQILVSRSIRDTFQDRRCAIFTRIIIVSARNYQNFQKNNTLTWGNIGFHRHRMNLWVLTFEGGIFLKNQENIDLVWFISVVAIISYRSSRVFITAHLLQVWQNIIWLIRYRNFDCLQLA